MFFFRLLIFQYLSFYPNIFLFFLDLSDYFVKRMQYWKFRQYPAGPVCLPRAQWTEPPKFGSIALPVLNTPGTGFQTAKTETIILQKRGAVNSVALHPIKQLAISGGGDAECHLWPFREAENTESNPLLCYGSHSAVVSW